MLNANSSCAKWSMVSVTLGLLAAFSVPMLGQEVQSASPLRGGYVEDWSHHHLVFSNPGTEAEALARGTYARWWKIVNDPRYAMQQAKRSSGAKTLDESSVHAIKPLAGADALEGLGRVEFGSIGPEQRRPGRIPLLSPYALHQDWDEPLITGGTVEPTMFPAKFSFSTTGAASCTSDYVVYPTGVPGSGTAASIAAYNELYGSATTGCDTTVPTLEWAYNTGSQMVTLSPVISNDSTGSQVAFIQSNGTTASLVLLKWAATPATSTFTGTENSTTSVTYTSGTEPTAADVGAQISGTNIPVPDYIAAVSGTTVTSATAATGSGSETLTIHAETLALPGVPVLATSAANYRSCTAPCYYTVPLVSASTARDDTFSNPFYDYADDAIYVGDDAGYLHQITGVFNGTPGEASPWPVLLSTGVKITSAIYDSTSGYVLAGGTTARILYSVGTGNAGTTNATIHGTSSALGVAGAEILDGPLVDSSAETVYAFVSDGTATGSNYYVYQFPATFTSGTGNTGSPQTLGIGYIIYGLLDGAFDNVYYASNNGTGGDLWVVGNMGDDGGTTAGSNLYYVPINSSGQMTTPVSAFSSLTVTGGTGGWTSNITEFCNNGTSPCGVGSGATICGTAGVTCTNAGKDYIYFSTDNLQTTTGACTTGGGSHDCVLGFNVSNISTTAGTVPAFSKTPVGETFSAGGISGTGCWSTGGFVVDNALTGSTSPAETGGSQIYYYALGSATTGNSPGGPTTPTTNVGNVSANCGNFTITNTPQAYQQSQTAP